MSEARGASSPIGSTRFTATLDYIFYTDDEAPRAAAAAA